MKKDSLICFRVNKKLQESLVQAAKADKRSLSSTIEIILSNYLKERNAFRGVEKRQYPRKALSVPAAISQEELGKNGIGAISDISLGGAGILISKDFKQQLLMDSEGSRFEIVFNLPSENKPIRMSCESTRVVDAEDSIHVGASFVDADFKSYKALQTYLM